MNTKKTLNLYLGLLVITVLTMVILWWANSSSSFKEKDYPEIAKDGVLRVVTEYNSVGYYVSGDTIAGFQYELCKYIEKQSGLTVEIHLENNLGKSIEGLNNGQYDVIARNIPITVDNKNLMDFTEPITINRQVLVQRKKEANNDIAPIRNQIELAGKTLYIPENSPSLLRLHNLENEIADTIQIIEDPLYSDEQLIYMVAEGDIDYAVVDYEIAKRNKKNIPQIDIETDISFTQLQAWAVRKTSPILLDSLNHWLKKADKEIILDKKKTRK